MVFVFGSNEAGIHGAGAAAYARKFRGAILGKGLGRMGDSFAIPTKDQNIETLSLKVIRDYVNIFVSYARQEPTTNFMVSAVGCGLAGLTAEIMAPMFVDASDNCWFDSTWAEYLPGKKIWGTFVNGKYEHTHEYCEAMDE
jgi:hypothetical protein